MEFWNIEMKNFCKADAEKYDTRFMRMILYELYDIAWDRMISDLGV